MGWTIWVYVLVGLKFALLAVALVMVLMSLAGCSSASPDLARQKAVQDCILSGGHARLGPGNTILCDRSSL